MTRRTLNTHVRDEQGQGLAISLLVMFLISVLVVGVLTFTATNQRHAGYSKSVQVATSLAEAGLNNAASTLAAAAVPTSTNNGLLVPNPNTCTSSLLPSSASAATPKSYSGGTVKWWGYFDQTVHADNTTDCQNWVWTLKGQATVPNPTGPNSSPIVKTVTAQVKVNAPVKTNFGVGVWNTIYSPYGPTPGVCDTSIGQGINISVPVYVGGNLCMGQNATITRSVYVGGFLFFNNKQGSIGSNSAPINSAHVGSYCQVQNTGTQVNPCKSEPQPNNKSTNIWVTGAPNNLSGPASDFVGITAPAICWDGSQSACTNTPPGGWYTYASPGPLHPCSSPAAGQPTFDTSPPNGWNDTYQNTVFNLTPPTSYTCQTAQGELTWNAAARTLKVVGTVFFDGSITMTTSGNQAITYIGQNSCANPGDCQSVIYASGDISINSEKLCAVLNSSGNDCDWNNWDPNKKILIFASNGPTGVTVGPSQTSFQGGLYATNTVATGQSALTEGPLVSGTKTVVLGQQFGGTFPPITLLPFSIANPPGAFTITPAFNFG